MSTTGAMKDPSRARIDLSRIRRILIIQYRPFGDVLLNTGYFPFLRSRFPEARIDFLVCRPYDQVLAGNPYIDELVVFHKGHGIRFLPKRIALYLRLRRRRYDLVIDQMSGATSAQMVLFSGAPYRIGRTRSHWRFVYNIPVSDGRPRYSAAEKFDLLAPLGIPEQPFSLFYQIRSESIAYIEAWLKKNSLPTDRLICISPGSPRSYKKWRAEHFARLADMIQTRSEYRVVLLWGPDEKTDVERVLQAMTTPAIAAPPTDFNQAAALLTRCRLLICNDGGLNHLAAAVNTDSLAIFGNTNPVNWNPDHAPGHYYLFHPHADSTRDDSFGIPPEEAFSRVQSILNGTNAMPKGAGV